MTSFSRIVFLPLTFLLLLNEEIFCVICYIRSLSYRTRRNPSSKLYSSTKIFPGSISTSWDDGNDNNANTRGNAQTEKKSQTKIEFVNFWGTKITSNDNNEMAEMTDPRHVPFVPTLDVNDGPLPHGAYIMEGNPAFDAKSTCRISIDVKTGTVDTIDDNDAVVRRLQSCIDAGFDTFQLHDQTSRSLNIIRDMNKNTPSYVNQHWTVNLKIQSISPDPNLLATKLDVRQTVLDLVEQTGSDALDSLKVDFGSFQAAKSGDFLLEIFEHLVDLQREGWIRSIGIRDVESQQLHDVMTYFGDYTDFEEREGNLLLPGPAISSNNCNSKPYIRMANALAGGLLTDIYSDDRRRRKSAHYSSSTTQPFLSNDNMHLLNEWAKLRKRQKKSISTSVPVWKQYQDDVVGQLGWIAMKHDVSISAVALRWALECGSTAIGTNGEGQIVSSALADIEFDSPKDDVAEKLAELRQVFRFQLDEEDRLILCDLSASELDEIRSEEEEGNPDIDFNNPALWL